MKPSQITLAKDNKTIHTTGNTACLNEDEHIKENPDTFDFELTINAVPLFFNYQI